MFGKFNVIYADEIRVDQSRLAFGVTITRSAFDIIVNASVTPHRYKCKSYRYWTRFP